MSTMIDGVWIKKFVTPELLEKIRNADFVELHLETNDGKVGEVVTFYSKDVLHKYYKP